MICEGYKEGKFAPGVGGGRKFYYGVGHNVLRAHAAAVKTYRTWYQPAQQGKIGLTTNVVWAEPLTNSFEGECTWLCADQRPLQQLQPLSNGS